MKSSVIAIVSFGLGAAVGTGATYIYIKKKYAQTVNDEIEAIRAKYAKPNSEEEVEAEPVVENSKGEELAKKNLNKPDISEYAKQLRDNGYRVNYSDSEPEERKFVSYIEPDEFGADGEYDSVSLTYYADGVLADDMDEIVDDFIDIVGNFTTHFGEYEDDVVYVRNDDRETYYEIVRDLRKYKDLIGDDN